MVRIVSFGGLGQTVIDGWRDGGMDRNRMGLGHGRYVNLQCACMCDVSAPYVLH